MAIYDNPNVINEEAEVLNEGMSKVSNPPKDFYSITKGIFDQVHNKVKSMGVNRGMWSKDKKFGDEKSYIKSLDKSKNTLDEAEKKNKNIIKLSLNLFYLECKSINSPDGLASKIASIIHSEGFRINPKSKNLLKRMFIKRVNYKELDDNNVMILEWNLTWTTNYGVPVAFNNFTLKSYVVKNDEKTMKHLNMLENAYEMKDDYGIFGECNLI